MVTGLLIERHEQALEICAARNLVSGGGITAALRFSFFRMVIDSEIVVVVVVAVTDVVVVVVVVVDVAMIEVDSAVDTILCEDS